MENYIEAKVITADLEEDTITFQLPKDFWKHNKVRVGTAKISIGGCVVEEKNNENRHS